jgi:hypothetical protein
VIAFENLVRCSAIWDSIGVGPQRLMKGGQQEKVKR